MTRVKKFSISFFIILWVLVFHYESARALYLSPALNMELPKLKLLFPPAGWIMFYEVNKSWSTAEVYGLKDGQEKPDFIDPHRIFETRFVGFDNIRRNIMVNALDPRMSNQFCTFLKRKFPEYAHFQIALAGYPDLVKERPAKKYLKPIYQC